MVKKRSGFSSGVRSGPSRRAEPGMGAYLRRAFLLRWNVLTFLGAAAAAAISPFPGVLLPLVGAAELLFLTGLVSIPKFRAAVDREQHEGHSGAQPEPGARSSERPLRELLSRISDSAQKRFCDLRDRCIEMSSIASGVSGRAKTGTAPASEISGPGLDRLLWVFLRLLVSQNALARFLDATDEAEMQRQLEETRAALAGAEERAEERMVRTLRDSLATSELRLDNYRKADSNAQYVSLELDRLERKIQALSEMAVNRQDPDFISREVDSVTESITQTEAAMNELQLVTGMMEDLDAPPPILSSDYDRALDHEA